MLLKATKLKLPTFSINGLLMRWRKVFVPLCVCVTKNCWQDNKCWNWEMLINSNCWFCMNQLANTRTNIQSVVDIIIVRMLLLVKCLCTFGNFRRSHFGHVHVTYVLINGHLSPHPLHSTFRIEKEIKKNGRTHIKNYFRNRNPLLKYGENVLPSTSISKKQTWHS